VKNVLNKAKVNMCDTVVELIHSKYTTGNSLKPFTEKGKSSPSSSQSFIHSKSLQHSTSAFRSSINK